MMSQGSIDTLAARLTIVEEHVRQENAHDLNGIMATFGPSARYDDEPWAAHHVGPDQVRAYYDDLLRAMPDLQVDIQRRHACEDAVILEVVIRGRHLGPWRGIPATGRQIALPLCGIFSFDQDNQIAGEKIYYDRAAVLQQLGLLHDPESMAGRVTTALMHPLTLARIAARNLGMSRSK
jgi:steroid delta-isomerase-like uncharacterized protein